MIEYTRTETKAWALNKLTGFYQCPISPVTADGKIDEAALRENVEKFIDVGINGLVIGGFISECWNLTLSEWYRYHEVIAEVAKGRLPIWTIILDPSVHQALEKLDFCEKLGFEGAEVINPVVQLRTDDEIFDWFKYLTDHSNLAICLYRTPVSGKVLGFDLVKRLADLDTVVAVKQGSLVRAETLKLRRMVRDDFIVSDPTEAVFLDDLRHGGQIVWGEMSYLVYGKKRGLIDQYRKLAAAGKWEEAHQASGQLAPVREFLEDLLLWEIAKTGTYAAAVGGIKVWFEALGFKAGSLIPPVAPPSAEKKEWIRSKVKELGLV
jgi:4-hydroxy-tetrahydrodipicolinate synthase